MLYDIAKLPSVIEIGRTGEHRFNTISIDMTSWLNKMPQGVPRIVHIRPGETEDDAYIAETTFENGIISWEVLSTDLGSKAGFGVMEVWLEEISGLTLEKRGKSAIAATVVNRAINDAADTSPIARNLLFNLQAEATTLAPDQPATATVQHDGYYGIYKLIIGTPKGEKGDPPDIAITEITGGHRVTFGTGASAVSFDVLDGEKGADGDPAPAETVATAVTAWMNEHITDDPTVVIDNSLTVEGAAADAKATGEAIEAVDRNDSADQSDAFLRTNDLDCILSQKTNVFLSPYVMNDMINNSIILSNGTIDTGDNRKGYMVSPLVEIVAGKTYGLKVHHNTTIGDIGMGSLSGFGLFGTDGESVVARGNYSNLGDDIYIFEIPNGAKYIRFIVTKGRADDVNNDRVLSEFNQWILLPDADNTIDDSFFVLESTKPDGTIDKLRRGDGSKLLIRDGRVGDIEELTTTEKSDVVAAVNEVAGNVALKLNSPSVNGEEGQVLTSDGLGGQSWRTPSGGSGGGAADAWLRQNDLDAVADGKVNTLATPYVIADLLDNTTIYSNGTINTGSTYAGYMVSPLVEVVPGKTYGLKVHHSTTIGDIGMTQNTAGFGLFGSDGNTTVARGNYASLGNDIYIFEIPSSAKYIRFVLTKGRGDDQNNSRVLAEFNQWILLPDANTTITDSFFVLAQKKENGEIDKLKRIDGSYLSLKDTTAREAVAEVLAMPISFGRRTCALFEKVCVIGDSYVEGYIMNKSGTATANNEYSWVKHLENMTGRAYVNLGVSGATSASWINSEKGFTALHLASNKSQAYIIGLQINDAAQGLDVGTVADIGTDAQTYYGCTSKIIDEIFDVNNAAHVFLLTQPKNWTGEHTPYRTAILNIVEWYQTEGNGTHQTQVHLIDLLDYWKLFRYAGCWDSMANGHFTPVGYEYVAEIIMYAWSIYLNEHPLVFQDVNLIPFGTE